MKELARRPLDQDSETNAKKLFRLQQYKLMHLAEQNPLRVIVLRAEVQSLLLSEFQLQVGSVNDAERCIRELGMHLGEHGGFAWMVFIAHRVQALGGSLRQLEYSWNGICGWRS